jgi:hypothetical protein
VLPAGESASRFVYDGAEQTVLARYDTALPTARLVRPLGFTLTESDSFCAKVRGRVRSENFFAHSSFNAQIAFGFLNLQSTGPDRTGFTATPKAFDVVAFDYFPNITLFGGPSLGPTIIRSNLGQSYFSSIHFGFGSETELADPGEPDVPRDTPLTAELRYNPVLRRATVRLSANGVFLPINFGGGPDSDASTITTPLPAGGFSVDAFGFLLWQDTNPFSGGATTVRADVEYASVSVFAPGYGDFDGDCDVDVDDLHLFVQCRSGPDVPLTPSCERFDSDGDNDVDQADFGRFQVNYTPAETE